MRLFDTIKILLFLLIGLASAQQFTVSSAWYGKYVTIGTAWGDYDNDGNVDLYLSNGTQSYQWENLLYRNLGNGTFDSVTTAGSITTDVFTHGGAAWGDHDNDGYLDMLNGNPFTRSGGFFTNYAETKLYVNNQDGTFTDNTSMGDAGLESSSDSKIGAVWADFNNDGLLDMLESNAAFLGGQRAFTMFTNNGDGTYTTYTSNITTQGESGQAGLSWADFDEDGDMDVVTLSGTVAGNTVLWTNNGTDWDSTNILVGGGATGPNSQSATWFDYDNDGDLDLYIGLGADDNSNPQNNHLFRNDAGTLVEVTSGVGPIITDGTLTIGTAAADIDNDGDLDLFVGSDGGSANGYRNHLYINDGTGVFTDFGTAAPGDSNFTRSVAFADIDNDGDMDMMLGREGPNLMYINNGNVGTHWQQIKLVGNGTTINTSAIGALVKVTATIGGASKTLIRDVSAQTGRGSHNMLRKHFGLGDATSVSTIQVKWPGPGTLTSYTDLPVDKIMVYKYGTSTGTVDVIPSQNFMYLIGSSGGSVEFASASSTAGTLTITRTDSDPGSAGFSGSATAPDASTVTPNTVSPDKYWTMSETGLTSYGARVYIDISGIAGVSNADRLVIVQRANSGNAWVPLNTSRMGNTLYTTGTVSSLGEFGIGSNTADNALPVELASFEAASGDQRVELKWSTASELENAGFVIERADEGSDFFTEIASYKTNSALRGRISSNSLTEYSYTDVNLINGRGYRYRLSDVSIAGLRSELAVLEARPMVRITDFRLHPNFPNPFNPSTKITFDVPVSAGNAQVEINVYNSLGQLVTALYRGTLNPGSHQFEWNGTNRFGEQQSSGVYIVRASVGNRFVQTIKMLLVK